MKKLTLLAAASLISFHVFAEEAVQTNIDQVMAPQEHRGVSHEAQVSTDMDAVLGPQGSAEAPMRKIKLESGHYVIGSERLDSETRSLFVEHSVTGRDHYVALLVENSVFYRHGGVGNLYYGTLIKDDTIMFSPMVKADKTGQMVSQAKGSASAPVLLVSLKPDAKDQRYPYMVQGINGAMHGRLLGMRGGSTHASLAVHPDGYEFHWDDHDMRSERGEVWVQGRDMIMSRPGSDNYSYHLSRFNGQNSALFTMTSSVLNTMAELDATKPEVQGIAAFIHVPDCKDEILVVAKPITGSSDLSVSVYAPDWGTNWLERFFGHLFGTIGNTSPTDNGWFN